jgi:hypothetical protein
VRSSSRHSIGDAIWRLTIFIAMRHDHVSMLGDCASSATCVAIDSRSDPTSSRCQISRTRTKPWRPRTDAKDVLCGRVKIPAGGARRDRTDDLLLAKQALSQLSYGPSGYRGSEVSNEEEPARLIAGDYRSLKWWAWEDLNFRPHAYQARALTN